MSTIDWQLVVEKVERHLEGWQTKAMSTGGGGGGGRGAIDAGMVNPIHDTSVLPLNVQSASRSGEVTGRLNSRFQWKSSRRGQSRCLEMVSWDVVC